MGKKTVKGPKNGGRRDKTFLGKNTCQDGVGGGRIWLICIFCTTEKTIKSIFHLFKKTGVFYSVPKEFVFHTVPRRFVFHPVPKKSFFPSLKMFVFHPVPKSLYFSLRQALKILYPDWEAVLCQAHCQEYWCLRRCKPHRYVSIYHLYYLYLLYLIYFIFLCIYQSIYQSFIYLSI